MKIYNTLTRQKEEFVPQESGKVKIYACGPTVYNFIHLGNARPLVAFDTLRRYLEYKGYKVEFIQNFTDIDDKVIQKANAQHKTIYEVSDLYIDEYFHDADALNVKRASLYPRATEHISEMITLIKNLIDKGYAYVANDGVYYSVEKFPTYLKLSHFNREELLDNVSREKDDNSGKRFPADFVLWKFEKPNEPSWDSPWGKGRPGWHTECSVMSRKYLGDSLDIHCGGKDLIFPHHENEIAQSEAETGKIFAYYWMHNGFINVQNEKMSKSKGNFFLVREIANEYGYMPIRLFLLNSQYRAPISYSPEMLLSSKAAFERIDTCHKNLQFALHNSTSFEAVDSELATEQTQKIEQFLAATVSNFEAAMDDDLNTAQALACIFDLVKEINIILANPQSKAGLEKSLEVLETLTAVLGLKLTAEDEIPAEVFALVEKRTAAKKSKDYDLADQYRNEILALGYKVIDTSKGPQVEKNN